MIFKANTNYSIYLDDIWDLNHTNIVTFSFVDETKVFLPFLHKLEFSLYLISVLPQLLCDP